MFIKYLSEILPHHQRFTVDPIGLFGRSWNKNLTQKCPLILRSQSLLSISKLKLNKTPTDKNALWTLDKYRCSFPFMNQHKFLSFSTDINFMSYHIKKYLRWNQFGALLNVSFSSQMERENPNFSFLWVCFYVWVLLHKLLLKFSN